ncbi:hypothetical protein Q31a_20670 [Aureliella helgolandensis]|uniref:Uncharacterized protein n=1 Tax=Aureliella helgolandensis TaxID=2527968 RepID=A0A518G592_9BACT|nr:hypothetical protein Q31a_20670 [Aureliella helgolandensis]
MQARGKGILSASPRTGAPSYDLPKFSHFSTFGAWISAARVLRNGGQLSLLRNEQQNGLLE